MQYSGKTIFHHLFSWSRKAEWKKFSVSQEIRDHLVQSAISPLPELLERLKTKDTGLSQREARKRLEQYGANTVVSERTPTWYFTLFKNFANPFVLVLLALSILSYFLKNSAATILILLMVVLSVLMRFIQEYRSNKSAEKLKALVSNKATVYRDSETPQEIPFRTLVPGDILSLSVGDMLPADVRLISSHDLFLSQASLNGEAFPLEKLETFDPKGIEKLQPVEIGNLCLMGTSVVSGVGRAVVISTGDHTYFGSIAKTIVGQRPTTSFDIGINKVSWLLIRIMLCMVPVVFVVNGIGKGDWFESLLFALSVAVGLTPEMLPMIVTSNLAKGAVAMARSKVIVKQLNSIQNFGAMDVLCTDKTGTLTEDRIILEQHLDLNGQTDEKVLDFAYLNSHFQTGLKNLLDVAILEHKDRETTLLTAYKKIDEIPFDFSRKRMSVIVQAESGEHFLICKGSFGTMLSTCTQAQEKEGVVPLNDAIIAQANHLHDALNNEGLRVLSVAYKKIPGETAPAYHTKDEHSLILMGFLSFLDPPKQSALQAIQELQSLGITIKVLTGDNEVVTKKICGWVGLDTKEILLGSEIDSLDATTLAERIEKAVIFAKLNPMHKSLIIDHLKSKGHTVGYLGDGINDAPALREADLGISVNTAADIAKESSDMIMLEKSLRFLGQGVIEGRKTFGNIIKYIKMALSSNFGNVFSILGASLFLPFLPMLPLQLLLQNLLYDISQLAIPFDSVDKEYLLQPRQWNPQGISRFMFFIGPISSIFDYTTFGVLWFVFQANSPAHQSLFQSGWFVEGLLSQVLIVHMIRTQKIPFIQSFPSLALLFTTLTIMIIGIIIPYSPIGKIIGMTPLPGSYFLWLIPTLLCYCITVQIVKRWYIKRFGSWL